MAAVGVLVSMPAFAGQTTDRHGNIGFDTLAECDAAVASGKAKFYQPFTNQPPLKREGEADVKAMKLSDLVGAGEAAKALGFSSADYKNGACDIGVGRSNNRDGVGASLIGKFVPYGANMDVNVYFDAKGQIVRATMKRCDNNFGAALPRPVPSVPLAVLGNTECFATVVNPAKFENRTERVLKVAATKRYEPIAPTFKTITEQMLVSPEYSRQIPVPATYKTVSDDVVVRPASFREEPVAATFKTVTERLLVKPESTRIEVVQGTFKTATEKLLISPERKELRIVPATYGEREEVVVLSPATTRVESVPATFKTVSEQVLAKAESVLYEPLALPNRIVSERALSSEATSRLEATQATYRSVSERVLVKEASKRLEVVPAVFETVTERVKVADASREWKRGRAWVGKAISVRPVRGFEIGSDGKVEGSSVAGLRADGKIDVIKVDTTVVDANNTSLDDDVMCLVEFPERFEIITKQVLKTPASTRTIDIPAEYTTVTRQVLDQAAGTRKIDVPATYQTVTRQVIDVERLRTQGYKFDEAGDIIAMPNGDRVLRASVVNGSAARADAAAAAAQAAAQAAKAPASSASGPSGSSGPAPVAIAPRVSEGAASGKVGYVREIRIAAQFQTVTRQVVDKPATTREVLVPAVSGPVKRRVELTPARSVESTIAAVYQDVSRQVVDKPATTKEVVVAAEYTTVSRQVVDKPATTRRIPIAAVSEKLDRRVIDQAATVREELVPAVYRPISRQVIDLPATVREIDVPAQYESITTRFMVSEGSTEQRSVLCETNATPSKIKEIQQALKTAGQNPGPINGVLRAQTMDAVNKFQQAKGLPVDGFLSIDTVKALGVSPN